MTTPSDDSVDLVVGADSMIGSALLRGLHVQGRLAVGTSRRPTADAATIHLDLSAPPTVWKGPPVKTAYLCAAVARLDACRRDPAGAEAVNVAGAVQVARLLAAQGAFVVYLSTNHVFDGALPYRRPDETTCPPNEYGRQKAAAEQQLLALGESVAVLRLTKVVGARVALFDGWAESLRKGERIRPFTDMSMAPVPLPTVVEVLAALGARRWAGVRHLSGNRDVSYAKIARMVARLGGASETLVEPIAARTADPSVEPPPKYTTLDVGSLPLVLGVTMPDVAATIRATFEPGAGRLRNVA